MTAPVPLSVRRLVRRVQDESGSVDPREISGKVLASMSEADLRSALGEVLPEFVRQCMSKDRRKVFAAPTARVGPSVAACRDWYQTLLSQGVFVPRGVGQWKALGECDRDDLLSIAAGLRDAAARNVATANRYEALADVVGAKTVAKVPAARVEAVFGRAAA